MTDRTVGYNTIKTVGIAPEKVISSDFAKAFFHSQKYVAFPAFVMCTCIFASRVFHIKRLSRAEAWRRQEAVIPQYVRCPT